MILNKNLIKYLQEGGAMEPAPEESAAPAAAPAPEAGGPDPIKQTAGQLLDMLMQQIGDPQAVAAILQAALEMLQSAAAPQEPVFQRRGGKLMRVK